MEIINDLDLTPSSPPQSNNPTINNEDITVTQNGTYTCSEGYTGLGTVEVNVPSAFNGILNCLKYGADIDSNGIASNFRVTYTADNTGVSNGYNKIGGIHAIFTNNSAVTNVKVCNLVYQYGLTNLQQGAFKGLYKFKLDENGTDYQFCGKQAPYYGDAGNSLILSINSTRDTLNFKTYDENRNFSYNFAANTWYWLTITYGWSGSSWQFVLEISTDGTNYTQLGQFNKEINKSTLEKLLSVALGVSYDWYTNTDLTSVTNGVHIFDGEIDLLETGFSFYSSENGWHNFMLAEEESV